VSSNNVNHVGDELIDAAEAIGVFGFEVQGQAVSLISLPMGVFAQIQERTGLKFLQVLDDPLGDMGVGITLFEACRAKVGYQPQGEVTLEELVRALIKTPSDLPPPVDVEGDGSLDPTSETATPGS